MPVINLTMPDPAELEMALHAATVTLSNGERPPEWTQRIVQGSFLLPKPENEMACPVSLTALPSLHPMKKSPPQFIRDLLASCPTAGTGVHSWLFGCARALHPFFSDKEQLYRLLASATSKCGRHVPAREIEDAIMNSADCAWQPGQTSPGEKRQPKWPCRDYSKIERIVRDGPTLAALSAASPVKFSGDLRATETIIDAIFPRLSLLCCGWGMSRFDTRTREEWRGSLASMPLIVPSPMTARTGLTKNGNPSAHCLDNTGPRRFLVVEFDFKEKNADGSDTADAPMLRALTADGKSVADVCAALHGHLSCLAPLALVVHSGGKSLHGWYYAEGEPEAKLLKFMRYAVSIGGDPATWTRSQFVRMPDGTRDNGSRQTVHYYNPEVIQ